MGRPAQLTAQAEWNFACPDWIDRLKSGRSLVPPLPLDMKEAERAVRVFNKLRLPDVEKTPSFGEAGGEWFRDIVRAIFGSLDDNGIRRVSEIFTLVPKKNNKTTGGGAIMLTALILNKRPRAEFLLVGPTQEIADLAFQQVSGMIAADPEGYLQKRFKVRDHLKSIEDLTNKAVLKIKTFDTHVMTGVKPVGVLVDELHDMSSYSYASRVIGQIRGGLLPRPEGFLIFITTQSDQPPAGCFKAELTLARGIRDGRVPADAATMLPILYEFPEEMQRDESKPWANSKNWPMVLPNLGLSITMEKLEQGFAQAKEKGEEEVRRWASQHLNIQIGLGLHDGSWLGALYWPGAARPQITLDYIKRNCETVVIGIDGGGLDDLLGLGIIGRSRHTKRWLGWCHAWAQPEVFERRKEIAETLRDFEKDGDLTVCKHPTQDVEELADIAADLLNAGLLPEKAAVGLDPVGISAIVEALVAKKFEMEQLLAIQQGFRLAPAIWGLPRKLKDGTFLHDGSGLMNFCVGNAKGEQRGNAIVIDKAVSGKAKIDPLVALFNAFMLMSRNPEAKPDISSFIKNPVMAA